MRGQGLLSGCSRRVSRDRLRGRGRFAAATHGGRPSAATWSGRASISADLMSLLSVWHVHIPGASTAATQEPMGTPTSRAFYVRVDFSDLAHNSIQQRKRSHSGEGVSQACLPDYRQSSFVQYVLGRRPFPRNVIPPACRSAADRLGSRTISRVQASLHSYDAAVDWQIDARDVAAFVGRQEKNG
jgi:hypothetical protein